VAHWVFDCAGDYFLLAGGTVTHATTVIEIEVVALGEFEDTFFVAGPVQFDARFLKNDFSHVSHRNRKRKKRKLLMRMSDEDAESD
jgi:hypothetical protein